MGNAMTHNNVSDTAGPHQAEADKEESHHERPHWHFPPGRYLTNVKDSFCFLFASNKILISVCSCLVCDFVFTEILENSPTIFPMTKHHQK